MFVGIHTAYFKVYPLKDAGQRKSFPESLTSCPVWTIPIFAVRQHAGVCVGSPSLDVLVELVNAVLPPEVAHEGERQEDANDEPGARVRVVGPHDRRDRILRVAADVRDLVHLLHFFHVRQQVHVVVIICSSGLLSFGELHLVVVDCHRIDKDEREVAAQVARRPDAAVLWRDPVPATDAQHLQRLAESVEEERVVGDCHPREDPVEDLRVDLDPVLLDVLVPAADRDHAHYDHEQDGAGHHDRRIEHDVVGDPRVQAAPGRRVCRARVFGSEVTTEEEKCGTIGDGQQREGLAQRVDDPLLRAPVRHRLRVVRAFLLVDHVERHVLLHHLADHAAAVHAGGKAGGQQWAQQGAGRRGGHGALGRTEGELREARSSMRNGWPPQQSPMMTQRSHVAGTGPATLIGHARGVDMSIFGPRGLAGNSPETHDDWMIKGEWVRLLILEDGSGYE
ncbi:hypothetical protein ON010_g951 [Phytophthora cinnamomi]|nr:hypothetical protein ON010_g951 [Phytophthora cinnamomi]